MDLPDLIELDRRHLWHPYTSMMDPLPAYAVASAQGVRLRLADGRELIDGMSSWWCAIHGYNHPQLNRAAQEQLERMAHVMFGGLTHTPAVELARRLIEMSPGDLEHVFLADSGSVSIEVAIKMALQYWIAQNESNKTKLLTLRGGYHGDTFGAMAVCDPVNGMHQLFTGVLPQHFFVDRPQCRFGETDVDLQNLDAVLQAHHGEIAALILEPIVQGAGGMWFYSADYLQKAVALCRHYDVLVIADEIATGFGRAGRLFACEYAAVVPDIMCVGKALTGGYLTLGATLANPRVAKGISAGGGVLMHGPTFMGNPLACAVANASIELLFDAGWYDQVARIETQLKTHLAVYNNHPEVADVRVLGAIGVVEAKTPVDVGKVQRRLVDTGVWIRPFGRLIYLMPPYIINDEDLARLCTAISVALDDKQDDR